MFYYDKWYELAHITYVSLFLPSAYFMIAYGFCNMQWPSPTMKHVYINIVCKYTSKTHFLYIVYFIHYMYTYMSIDCIPSEYLGYLGYIFAPWSSPWIDQQWSLCWKMGRIFAFSHLVFSSPLGYFAKTA
jgi:hypothetical protein